MSSGLISLFDIGHCQFALRWHTTDHNGEQSLASHSFNVTMFAVAIAKRVMGERFSDEEELKLLRYCLNHDVAELVTGDQPSPYKRALRKKMPKIDEVLESIEEEVYPIAAEYKRDIKDSPLAIIAKLADILDARHFIEIKGQDTPQNKRIIEKLNLYIIEKLQAAAAQYPGYDWRGFNDVMDELFTAPSAKELFEDMA